MRQTATVVQHDGKLMAEVIRSEACQTCHACKFGQQEKVYVDLGRLKCEPGDVVEIELDDKNFSMASVIAYGLPVLLFFAMLFISRSFTTNEYFQALWALGGLLAGLLCVKIIDRYVKAGGRYTPRVTLHRGNGEKNG